MEKTSPADMLLFRELCNLLNKIKHTSSKKEELMSDFLEQIRANSANTLEKNWTFFPILRLLTPKLDRERPAYNLKEEKLRKLMIKVLSLHKDSADAKKILKGNDLFRALFYPLKTLCSSGCNLTVKDVNDYLDKIAFKDTENKSISLDDIFSNLVTKVTPEQYIWFLKIVLKDLKLEGLSAKKILSIYHPDAPELYDACSSLHKVCEELAEGHFSPQLQIFCAFSPMLSERLDVKAIGKLSADKEYCIETKFDGERFQIHMNNGKFEYFSRRGFNFTSKFGSYYESDGLLTPHLKNCISAESFILDGEMMGWHKEKQCFGSKGMSFDVKKLTTDSHHRPCFCVFDILYYNGKSLALSSDKGGIPLHERQSILDKIITDKCGIIMLSKRKKVETGPITYELGMENILKMLPIEKPFRGVLLRNTITSVSHQESSSCSDIIKALTTANERGDEGIVVKDVNSYYIANCRNGGWYKIKPEYTEGMMTDIDLVIVGGDFAEGKRQIIKSFVLALTDPDTESGVGDRRWLSVGRVATGLSFEERQRLSDLLEPQWHCDTPSPSCLVWGKAKPDFWIHPDHSYVLQVRATELIRSQDFATDYTLRFPRVEKVRDDKPVKDILTLSQFKDLVQSNAPVIKLSKNEMSIENIEIGSLKKTRKRTVKPLQVAAPFRKAAKTMAPVSSALLNRKLIVLSDDADCTKQELENIIFSHSGIVVQSTVPDLWCCVAGRVNAQVTNVIKTGAADILTTKWLRAIPESNEPCTIPPPIDFLFTTIKTRAQHAFQYDKFADSYTRDIDIPALKALFNKMDFDGLPKIHLMTDEKLDLDKKLFNGPNPFSFLRSCFIHLYKTPYTSLIIKAKMYGASLCEIDSPNLTHVLVPDDIKSTELRNLKKDSQRAMFVKKAWLEKCFSVGQFLSAEHFIVHGS